MYPGFLSSDFYAQQNGRIKEYLRSFHWSEVDQQSVRGSQDLVRFIILIFGFMLILCRFPGGKARWTEWQLTGIRPREWGWCSCATRQMAFRFSTDTSWRYACQMHCVFEVPLFVTGFIALIWKSTRNSRWHRCIRNSHGKRLYPNILYH